MHNWRDYGDRAGGHGRRIAAGQLYRSAAPAALADSERRRIEALKLATIIDLRGTSERLENPTFWPGFSAPVSSVEGETSGRFRLPDNTGGPYDAAVAHQAMLDLYTEMPYRPGLLPAYRNYFRSLSVVQGPTLIYCSAGKDRTGLAVALLQHLLGVHTDDIMSEYLRSNAASSPDTARAMLKQLLRLRFNITMTPDGLLAFGSVHPDYLRTSLRVIESRSGSIDAYLREVLGVGPEMRAAIERRVLV